MPLRMHQNVTFTRPPHTLLPSRPPAARPPNFENVVAPLTGNRISYQWAPHW